jgi:uracil phosphoribosyltransferase
MSDELGSPAGREIRHAYGERVHLLDDVHLLTLLARLGSPEVRHPEMTMILRTMYGALLGTVVGTEFPRVTGEVPTRMVGHHPEQGVYRGPVLDPTTEVVVVDVVRGGIVPAQVCFEMLNSVLPNGNVRLDHLSMARVSDELGHVTGVDLQGSKIGGSVADRVLLFPDPMGATGSTFVRALEHYLEHYGRPSLIIGMPLIVTPEFLAAVMGRFERLVIYSARLDRGLSPPDVLVTDPGTHWERERGLDASGYIVPGAGGMGEVLNNSWC